METPDSKTPSSTTTTKNKNNKNIKLINPSSSDSPAFQDSPTFGYISNLSPIQPVKAAAQGFPGLSSPPLLFTSPRVNLQTSFLSRQLQSPISNPEFSEDNKCQKKGVHSDNSAKVVLDLRSPSISGYPRGCNRKNVVQVAHHSVYGFPDEFLANPRVCTDTDSSNKRLSVDSPRSSGGGCLVQKDNVSFEDKALDGSPLPKVTENAQPKPRGGFKFVKLDSKRLIPASSENSSIIPKLSSAHTSEAGHLECGSLRRCLFDENQRKYSSDGSGSRNPSDDVASIQEVVNSSSPGTIEGREMISLSKPLTSGCASPTTGKYHVAISKPLGIGLHLNSIVYPRSMDNATSDQQSCEKVVRVIGKTSVLVASNQSAVKINASSIPTNLIGKVPAFFEDAHQNEASLVAMPGNPLASDAAEHLKDPMLLKPDDPSTMVGDKRKFNSELAETSQTSNPGSPKKKRKKSSSTPDDNTAKRCNCKRSKCLKLYCDCFAAGLYCAESCACQGCYNRVEYEDTVLEARQQIETRNPLAFAPKIVKPVTDSPASVKLQEVADLSTPSSARHKRGCNCKRSMCVKKYCECYQSGVGCSDGCRCEGCKNVYGKREDHHSFAREFMVKKVGNEMPGALLNESRLHNSPHVTPVTPALQCSDQRKNALKSRLPFKRFLQSPDSDQDTIPSDEISCCPINSPSNSMFVEETGRSMDISSSKTMDLRNVLGHESSAKSGVPPPSSNLRWRSSPMTPITESSRSEYLQDFINSGSKDSLIFEDETPEILKDPTNPSHDSVKVKSPNKKRVSPPHNHKASSESLKICHKYVLRALPSFPPLTPYSKKCGNNNKVDL